MGNCFINNLEKEKHMCLISEKDKEPSMLYYFKDATFNVDNVCRVCLLGEELAGFIFKNQSFEIRWNKQEGQGQNYPNVLLLPGLKAPSSLLSSEKHWASLGAPSSPLHPNTAPPFMEPISTPSSTDQLDKVQRKQVFFPQRTMETLYLSYSAS